MWTRLRLWLASLVRRDRFESDLAVEVEFHIRARASHWEERGLAPEEAIRRARIEFGNVPSYTDQVRRTRRGRWLDSFIRDLRYGGRMLAKHPSFTAMAVLSLAIGIGANTAIFSVVNAVLIRDEPVAGRERLVNLYERHPDFEFSPFSYPNLQNLRDGTGDVFSGIAATAFAFAQIDHDDGVEAAMAEAVTGDYFQTLGIAPLLGRAIAPEDDVAPGSHPVVMLSHSYWQRDFGGDPDVVGRTMRIGGRAYTVIGILPSDYRGSALGLATPALYAPMAMLDDLMGVPILDTRGAHMMFVRARLAPGVSRAAAEAAVSAVAQTVDAVRPNDWMPGQGFTLVPADQVRLYPGVDSVVEATAWVLIGVVGLLLLLACTNLASFLLARAIDRQREVALRLALGASRGAIARQMLTETTMLSLLGGALGLVLALGALQAFLGLDLNLPYGIRIDLDLGLDPTVLAFTLGLSILSAGAMGLLPAIQATRPRPSAALHSERTGGHPGQRRWRNGLVTSQITVSLVLLVGAGLFLRSWQQVLAVDPGFGRSPTALLSVMVPANRLSGAESVQYVDRLLERFRALPGVEAVGIIQDLPLDTSNSGVDFNVDGVAPPAGQEAFRAERGDVDGAFFQAAGIPILQGRAFDDTDGPDSRPVAIVSKAMAGRFWPDGDAVGRLVRRPAPDEPDVLIVGVADDIKIRTLGETPRDVIYLPYNQQPVIALVHFFARTSLDPGQTVLSLLEAGREVEPDLRVVDAKTMSEHLVFMRLPAELQALALSAFAVLGLTLATIGVFGAVRYAVAARVREMGIRMALGADASVVVRLLASGGLRLVVVGSVIGLVLSFLLSLLLGSLLFGIEAFDPLTFLGATGILFVTMLIAVYLPARRVRRVDPIVALRAD